VALLSVIRRWHFREGVPIREISRRLGVSRNTVRKYLNNKELDPRYPHRKSPSKLDDYERTLTSWLFREAKRHRKQRKSAKQLHSDLVQLGFTGSYDRVAAFSRQWREQQQIAKQGAGKRAFVPLLFAPGEAFQFDWGEDYAVIGGLKIKLQVAYFKLSHSRAFFLRAYPTQTHEMLFDAHNHAFRVLGGIPERGIYDNMKTAVDKVGRGKERRVNKRFQAMVSHYLFEAQFCNPAAGWEKGQVEKKVRDARHEIWHTLPKFTVLDDLNTWLERRCIELWQSAKHPDQPRRSVLDVWQEERASLMHTPAPFDGYVEHTKRVSSTCLINFDRNRYSVPASFANHHVSVHVYAQYLCVIAEGREIARHTRLFNRHHDAGQTVYNWRHYLSVAQRKPGALRNGAPFETLPDDFKTLQRYLLRRPQGDREMVEVLALVLHHDESLVIQAVAQSLRCDHPSKQHVVNCLSRLMQPIQPAPQPAPPRLILKEEPVANTHRYDALRSARHAH
jgi:transposase